jgi:two-component system, chemotaxis family, sensor histidine kinase and response regulator PixL
MLDPNLHDRVLTSIQNPKSKIQNPKSKIPMLEPDLRDRVYQMFLLEVPGLLETIETELVTLGIDRTATKVHNLLRAAHSIKGCAASLGLEEIRDLAHQFEAIFRVLNHPELPFDRPLEKLLFELYDCLFKLINCEIDRVPLPPGVGTKTQIVLANLDESIGHFVIAGANIPPGANLGIDMTRAIFEVDVAQSLIRLEGILVDPTAASTTVGEFRAQADVFTGVAELVTLPGFGKVAHATIAALDRHPDRAREICCFALADFNRGLAAVLAGDRVSGGSISPDFATLIASEPRLLDPVEINLAPTANERVEDLFDLEEIFDSPQERAFRQRKLAVVGNLLVDDEFDLIADFLDLPISVTMLDSNDESEAEFDFLLLDMISAPRLPIFLSDMDVRFDLADIFEPTIEIHSRDRQAALKAMAAAIAIDFDSLVPVTHQDLVSAGIVPIAKAVKPVRVEKSRKINTPKASQLSVRVAVDRLERMNNLVGELAIERHGLALHNEQLHETLKELRSKCENFQIVGERMRQIADKISIADLSISKPETVLSYAVENDLEQQFDPLELDRYGQLHGIAQETIEQLAQIEEQIEDLTLFSTQSDRQIDRQKQLLSHLRDDLMWSRMLPLGEILNRFPRTLHDLSIEYHKPCDLKITGAGVLVDKAAIEKLLDPLVHLLRNAFDHGIETPTIRQQQGKPERGSIEINAYHQGSQTVIEVRDDGRGIDMERVKAKGISLGLITAPDAATASVDRIFDLLFYPSFSTAARITELSGRGMGLDIVKAQIQAIKGTISISSEPRRGTTFTLRIPLTLTIAQLMVCQAGNAIYAFPADSIQRIIVPTAAEIQIQDSQRLLKWHHLTIPIYNLQDLLPYANPIAERIISQTLKVAVNNPLDWLPPILLIRTGERLVGLEIDRLIAEQELTIKPFGKSITPPSYSYGCTILGDGSILPVLDAHTLIRTVIDRPTPTLSQPPKSALEPIDSSKLVLVVDDSITSRQSLCLSLEKYGYRTIQAKDGQVALQLLRQKTTEIKLVICDVEMPNMNGFEFLNIRRQDPTLTHIPVVMLTSRSNTKHRQFAAHLGAIDYFIKPYLEADFMKAIGKLAIGG